MIIIVDLDIKIWNNWKLWNLCFCFCKCYYKKLFIVGLMGKKFVIWYLMLKKIKVL